MKAFHGSEEVKLTSDEFCCELLKEGLVKVDCNLGTATSTRWNKVLGSVNGGGYLVCTLHWKGIRKQIKLHRLVYLAAYEVIPNGLFIDHINQNKRDNRIVNLRLADPKLNSNNRRSYVGELNPAARINHDIAKAIRLENENLSYSKLAKKYNISKSLVAGIVRREIWL